MGCFADKSPDVLNLWREGIDAHIVERNFDFRHGQIQTGRYFLYRHPKRQDLVEGEILQDTQQTCLTSLARFERHEVRMPYGLCTGGKSALTLMFCGRRQ